MTHEVRFPVVSTGPGATGIVATWFSRDGERVTQGQVIAELAVDKVSYDVEAPAAGTLRTVVEEEAQVAQGDLIATIE
ncbi:MAG: lipoyl domain-containing protein [Actinomycetales bacterium]|nr:lipoyl domain-containing protein [Actinomycetales bacterium]